MIRSGSPAASIDLITDRPRTRNRTGVRDRVIVESTPGRTGAVPAGPFAVAAFAMAAFGVLLHAYAGGAGGGDGDLIVGVDLATTGRGRVRIPIDATMRFDRLLSVTEAALREPDAAPDASPHGDIAIGLTDHPAGTDSGVTGAGLVLIATGVAVHLDFAPDLFDRATVERMAGHLWQIATVVAGQPGIAIGDIDLLDDVQRARILDDFNGTTRPYEREVPIHRLVEQQARRTPDAPAVTCGPQRLTYRELDVEADRLAYRLRAAGVLAGQPVGLLLPRTPDMIVAALAILKAGGAYLPIDPDYPPERVAFLLADSGAGVLVTLSSLASEVNFTGRILAVDRDAAEARTGSGDPDGGDTGGDDAGARALRGGGRDSTGPGDPAYVIYTSGTTGRPKGVEVSHRSVVRLVRNTDYLDFSPATRTLATCSICFDVATFELWGPLCNGGSLHLVDTEVILRADALGRAIVEGAITTMWLTAPLFNQLVDQDPAIFRPLRHLLIGGDALSARHVAKVLDECPDTTVVNGYGPTENTTFSTTHVVTRDDLDRIPIGRPVANSTAYVLDRRGRLCPVGVPGELCVGGDGVALGYRGRPELTAEAFRPDPFRPGGTMYRTGDVARWRADGVLEFFGRRDHQVKVRGYRIELGEIESTLLEHPRVREAVVLAHTRPGGADRYLCAYHVAGTPVSSDELRSHLRRRLPEHMVPAVFVELPALPLNQSGKVDRERLPEPHLTAPGGDDTASRVGAAGGIEATLIGLAERALGIRGIDLDHDLRDLGADSLTATMLAVGAQAAFGVRVPVGQILRAGSVGHIAELFRGRSAASTRVPGPAPESATYPLSPQQRRLYIEQCKDTTAVHYNVPVTVELPADTDVDRLAAALARLTGRHDALRAEFVFADGDVRQRFLPSVTPRLIIVDGPGAPAGPFVGPFDLGRAPLWRAEIHRAGATPAGARVILRLDLHHIITDGISLALMITDLAALYADLGAPAAGSGATTAGAAGTAAPVPPYRDYAHWTSTSDGRAWRDGQEPFWRDAFHTQPDRAPPDRSPDRARRPDLPLDEPRPPIRSLDGGVVEFDLGPPRLAALRAIARAGDVTLFTVLAGAYAVLLSRLYGHADVTFGAPASGRTVPGFDRTLGMFVNTVCLRLRIDPDLTFTDLLRRADDTAREAFAHQDYPLEDLAAYVTPVRDYRRNPVFDALIALHSGRYLHVDFAGQRIPLRLEYNGQAVFDLNMQVYELAGSMPVSLQYGSAILRRGTVEAWRDRFLHIIDAVIADPRIPIRDLAVPAGVTRAPVPDFDFDFDL